MPLLNFAEFLLPLAPPGLQAIRATQGHSTHRSLFEPPS
jgi:hypothetical protein